MQSVALFLVFVATALLVLGTYAFVNRRRLAAAAALRDRLGTTGAIQQLSIFKDARRSAVPIVDRILASISISEGLESALRHGGLRWSIGEFVTVSTVGGALLFLLGMRWGAPIGLVLGIFGLAAPILYVKQMQERRARRFEEQLPDAIDMIVNAIRAGFSFQAAIKFVGEEVPAPLGEEFMRVYDEQRLGADVRSALLDLQERVGTLDAKMLVTSLLIQRETGGNLSEVLGGLATLIRDRAALRGQVDTLTAEPRFAGRLLALLPVVAFIVLSYLNKPMMETLLTLPAGKWIIAYGIASVAIGYFIMTRIANIDV